MKISNTMINFSSVCVSVYPSACSYSCVYSSPSSCLYVILHASFYVLLSIDISVTSCKCPESLSFLLPCESARRDCVIMQTFVQLLAINTTISLQIRMFLEFCLSTLFHWICISLPYLISSLTTLLSHFPFPSTCHPVY